MENLKKGDVVEINAGLTYHFRRGDKFTIDSVGEDTALLNVKINFHKGNFKKIGESKMQYEESNRYKLAQAVKEKVKLIKSKEVYATAEILSLATGNSKTYFSTQSAKSKFLSRGDLSEKTYQAMLTDLAFAEREVLGIGAKTADEAPIFTISGKPVEAKIIGKGNYLIDIEKDWLDEPVVEANKALDNFIQNQPEEKQTSNKPLFIGAAVVIFVALILLILNNYLQVV